MDMSRTPHAYHSSPSSSCLTCCTAAASQLLKPLIVFQAAAGLIFSNCKSNHIPHHPQPSPVKYLHIVWLKEKKKALYHDLLNT